MKQGTLINRIVMLLLLAAVLVYLGVSAWRSFRDPYTLVLSYAYTVDDSLEATGFLVREESVLASPGGIVDLLPEEGEKVSRGETVALLYQNDSGLARKEELQSLTMEKEQLQYALERTQSGGDSSQLSQQVIDAIVALRSSVSTGDLTRLEDETLLLKSLVYKRDFTFNGGEEDGDAAAAIQSSIDAVDAQIAALSAQAAQDTSRLTAGQAGVFSGQTDGYESLLTPALLETITPGQLSQLDRQRPQPDAGAVGKLVTDATWYFVCAMGEEEAGRLIEGRTVTVRFSRDWSGEVDRARGGADRHRPGDGGGKAGAGHRRVRPGGPAGRIQARHHPGPTGGFRSGEVRRRLGRQKGPAGRRRGNPLLGGAL